MVISDIFRLRDDIRARDFQAAVKSSGPEATAKKVPAGAFLARTFPTNDLVRLLKVVEAKFTRREKELGVIVIRSGMGGGKSHLITALDVILSNPGAAHEWAQKWPQVEFSPPPTPVRVIVRSLTEEPVENLWDCFFEGLGCLTLKDDPTIARQGHPDTALCEQALRDRPALFVLDELEDWLAQWDQQKRRRNLEFLKVLTGLAQEKPNFLLAASILGNDGELEGRLVRDGANEVFLNDANDQIQVILFRLFDGWTPNSRKLPLVSSTVDGYSTLYESVTARSPEFDLVRMHERMLATYPLHPALIDRLVKQVETANTDKDLGLGPRKAILLLQDLVRASVDRVDLILPADFNIADPALRNRLSTLDPQLTRLAANNIDDTAGIPHRELLLSTVLFFSFPVRGETGATYEDLFTSLLRPGGMNINQLDQCLKRLNGLAYNLHPSEDGSRWYFSPEESPAAKINNLARNRAKITDEEGKAELARVLRDFFGAPQGQFVLFDVPEATTRKPEPVRTTEEWRRFFQDCEDFDRGDSLTPTLIAAARQLARADRQQLVYYGRTYPNKFLLIEPSDSKFDLSDLTRPETQDLLDRARRVLACQRLLRDTPDTKENRAKRQTYERESQRALYGLRCLLHDAYGLWMRWPKLPIDPAHPQPEAVKVKPPKDEKATGQSFYEVLEKKLQDTLSPRFIGDHVRKMFFDEGVVRGRTVSELQQMLLKELGRPQVIDRTLLDTVRALPTHNAQPIRLAEDGGADYQDERVPPSVSDQRLLAFRLLEPKPVGTAIPEQEPAKPDEPSPVVTPSGGTTPASGGGGAASGGLWGGLTTPGSAAGTATAQRQAIQSCPSRTKLIEEFQHRLPRQDQQVQDVRIVVQAILKPDTPACELKPQLLGPAKGPDDQATVSVTYNLAGPFSSVTLGQALNSLPDLKGLEGRASYTAEYFDV